MAQATYVAKTRDALGQSATRTIQAENVNKAKEKLRSQGLVVLEISEKRTFDLVGSVNKFLAGFSGVKLKELTVFSRQFATMINAGVSMVRALSIMIDQTEGKKLKATVMQIKDEVEQGTSLSDAMKKHDRVFNKLFVSMVRAGETGGVLDQVLARLATFMEEQGKLISQVKSAMTYPVAVGVLAMLVLYFLLTFILPIFKDMFANLGGGAALPGFTQFLIDVSDILRTKFYVPIIVIGGIVYGYKQFVRTPWGRSFMDSIFLKMPLFGPLNRKVAVSRFTRTLGTLLKSGVPLITALEITEDTCGNIHIAKAIGSVRSAVREGEGMVRPLEKSGVFPAMVTQMISIGEETGAIDEMLNRIADFYDIEVTNTVKALSSLLEPLMMVVIAALVGSIIIGMYLPMFTLLSNIKA